MDVHYGSTINTLVWNNSLTHSLKHKLYINDKGERQERERGTM